MTVLHDSPPTTRESQTPEAVAGRGLHLGARPKSRTEEALINVDALLAPIPKHDAHNATGDPAGDRDAWYLIRNDLDEARKEIDPSRWDPKDPTRPKEAKQAEWPKVIDLASNTLKTRCKHLGLAERITEALTRTQGFAGLADGLMLMRRLVAECWDRLHPDAEDRDAVFDGMTAEGGDLFNAVRAVPIVAGKDGAFGLARWKNLSGAGAGPKEKEAYDVAVAGTSPAQAKATVDVLARAQAEFAELVKTLGEKMGAAAPPMPSLRTTLAEAAQLAGEIYQQKVPAGGEDQKKDEAAPAADGKPAAPKLDDWGTAERAALTRAEALRRIEEAAALLEKLEPLSPIPYLVRRAVNLGRTPLPTFLKEIVKDPKALAEIAREFGIPEAK